MYFISIFTLLYMEEDSFETGTMASLMSSEVTSFFFSWIFGFEGAVRIEGPEEVQKQYRKMVLDAAKRVK